MIITKERFWEIFRFGVVGTTAMLIHYGIYYVLLSYINMNIAYSIGYFLSFLCNYLMSSYYTFKTKPSLKKFIRFTCSHGINYFVYLGLFNFFYWVGVSEKLAPFPVYLIAVPISFLLVRFALKKSL
jgi:putative flippase GtrA